MQTDYCNNSCGFFFFFGFSGRAPKENGRTTGSQITYRVKKWAFVRMILDLWSAKQLKRTDLSYKSLYDAALVWHILHHSNHRVISGPNNSRSKHDGQVTYFHLHKNILQVINVLIWSKQEKNQIHPAEDQNKHNVTKSNSRDTPLKGTSLHKRR